MTAIAIPRRGLRVPTSAAYVIYGGAVGIAGGVRPTVGVVLALVPVALYLVVKPQVAAVALIASLPIVKNLYGNDYGSVNFGVSDVLFLIAILGLVPLLLLRQEWRTRVRAARPMLIWCTPFIAWLVVLLGAHLSLRVLLNTAQDLQLTAVAVIVGAAFLDRRSAKVAVWGFVGVSAVLALLWLTTQGHNSFAGNKNTAGQYFAYSILLLVALRGRWLVRAPLLGVLVGGLLLAASRGAIVGLAVGAISLLALRGLGSWKRTAGAVVVLSAALIVGYNTVPASVQLSIQSIGSDVGISSSSGGSSAAASNRLHDLEYNVKVRQVYRNDGLALARAHPLLGVGVGNYRAGTGYTMATDPHNVLIRNAAEGGYLDDAFFVLMVLGTAYLALRRLNRNPWAGLAIALQACMIAHAMVDIYWVRGIPVLPWVVFGMAVNPRLNRKADV